LLLSFKKFWLVSDFTVVSVKLSLVLSKRFGFVGEAISCADIPLKETAFSCKLIALLSEIFCGSRIFVSELSFF